MATVFTAPNHTIGIRPYQVEDAQALCDAVIESMPNVSRFLPWNIVNYTPQTARDWIETRPNAWQKADQYSFIIYNTQTGCFLGGLEIDHVDLQLHKCANLGYWVRTSELNKGIARVAASLGARFAFEELHLNRLEIIMDINNIPSRIVAEKIGAKQEGILRNRMRHHGVPHDAYMYSLLPGELIESNIS